MKTISEIKSEKEQRYNKLITDCRIFFAFNNDQFTEGLKKIELKEGEKIVALGAGGYIPKNEIDKFVQGQKEVNKWYKDTIKDNKARKQNIAYELNNHEAFYTNDISDTLDALGEGYSEEEVLEVFRAEKKKFDYSF